jgi:hypothetical protein
MENEDVTRALVGCLMQAFPEVHERVPPAYGPEEDTQPTGLKPPRKAGA